MFKKKLILLRGNVIGDFFTKYGLDTNVLVDLVLYPHAKKYFKLHGYTFPEKFLCTLSQCVGECKGVLIHRYGYTEEKAKQKIDLILNEFMIEKLTIVIDDDIKVIEEIGHEQGLNDEDVPIIYGFWKLKINLVVVRDQAFENTCKELNIKVIRWPRFN